LGSPCGSSICIGATSRRSLAARLLKCRIEGAGAGFEIEFLDERAGFGGPVFSVHPAVLPFDRERAGVADVVQSDDDLLEVDVAVAERAEIPVPARVGEVRVTAKHADRAVAVSPPHILHVNMINAGGKPADE